MEIRTPRIVPRQRHRENNQPGQSPKEYFRKSIYIPLLDSRIADLEERLSPEVLSLFQLGVFLPKSACTEVDLLAVREAVQIYNTLLHSPVVSVVLSEFQLWVTKWKREVESGNKLPESLPQVIELCDKDLYPNIRIFLQILATLPVSAATAERSFSTLRRLKTWLRANMGEERLTGLALLNIHKDIAINIDDIITRYAKTKQRRFNFVI